MAGMTLPAFLTEQTENKIMKRMLKVLPPDLDQSEGSFIWDSTAPSALMLADAATWAQEVLRRGFATTTFGAYLDLRCEERGITRRAAVKAVGQVEFTGVAGTKIPAGTRVATPADVVTNTSSVEFETVDAAVIASTGRVSAQIRAIEAGRSGIIPPRSIDVMVSPVQGVSGVMNAESTMGGADIETDESLLERFLLKVRSPGSSGNKANYMQWALDVAGVGGVQVLPLWNGPKTVKVVLIDPEKRAPSADVVNAVQQYIDPVTGTGEGMAPIGAEVTVVAAEEVPINIDVKLTLANNATLEEVKALIAKGTEEYLRQLAFKDRLVRYTRIAAILLDIPPIIDFAELTINNLSDKNIEMQLGQVAVLGTVNVHE
ncbi:baseplate J/gp47 family protein [Paenibacillus albiflavus]|uniref:Baseplate J/gp47 family protein n=1 Tax=Paenibacillus albiflavus TaxID=2545760 RepID=A0A4R4DYP3_9BACL|nr:baseplate J/gp47 family protein [Paenibacillus albiflavus]TCZ70962.1 baseplate J/gp47 family protein [Paenibacillus albiflavus]